MTRRIKLIVTVLVLIAVAALAVVVVKAPTSEGNNLAESSSEGVATESDLTGSEE